MENFEEVMKQIAVKVTLPGTNHLDQPIEYWKVQNTRRVRSLRVGKVEKPYNPNLARTTSGKPVMTPYGRFNSITEASNEIGLPIQRVFRNLKIQKEGWYRIELPE